MSGLVKPKKYDWKDSNLALFGSDTEKQVKKDSAKTEPAWRNAGSKPGLQVWRIVKFKVTHWPQEDYGKFYEGDSYIVLHTYKPDPDSDKLAWDVHFWIGKYSTQDEYGTAAYKTVELDTFLDDGPVQHREVQGHESQLFLSYFKELTYMKGGADSGFRKVKPVEYKPRLLHVHGDKKLVTVKEIAMKEENLKTDDVYILDCGLEIFQWNGTTCNKDEKFKAMQYVMKLKSDRGGKASVEALEEEDTPKTHDFYVQLRKFDGADDDDDADEDNNNQNNNDTVELHRLSDASGSMVMKKVKEGSVTKKDFDSKDVFIFDTGKDCFVWIGKRASDAERKNGLTYAHYTPEDWEYCHSCTEVIRYSHKAAYGREDLFKTITESRYVRNRLEIRDVNM